MDASEYFFSLTHAHTMKTTLNTGNSRRLTVLLLLMTVVLYFFANFQRTVIPGSIFSDLQSELNVSAARITAFGAAFMYIYAFSQLFSGIFADKYGGYRVIAVGGFLFCLGSLFFPLCSNINIMYLCRVVVGIGASSIYLSMVKEIQRAFPSNFAPCMGVAMLIGYAGGMAANAPFVAAIQYTGWRNGLIAVGIAMFAAWFLFTILRFTVKMPKPTGTRFSISAFAPAVRSSHNWLLFLLMGLTFAIFYAIQTVMGKKFLEDYCGMRAVSAGWVLTTTGALSALSNFCVPFLSSLFSNRRKPFILFMGAGTLIATGGSLAALFAGWHAPWFFTAIFLLLAVSANMTPIYLALLNETNKQENLGTCVSFSNALAYLLVALLGNFSGLLMDMFKSNIINGVRVYGANSYIAVFALFTILAAAAFAASLKIKETGGRHN